MVFMEAARGSRRVLSSLCLPWFSFDGSYRAIMVSECHLFFIYFFVICACQAVMHNREFMFCSAPLQVREMGAWCGFTAWRSQYFRRLAGPVFSPLGANTVFTPLGEAQY